MKNPAYAASVKARKLDLQPETGAEVERLIKLTLAATPAQKVAIQKAMGLK